jgi:hypothetical protein
LNGDMPAAAVITVPGAGRLAGVVVDAQGTGYITDMDLNSIYMYDNLATRTAAPSPDRKLTGLQTQLSGPGHLLLLPR